MEITILLTTFVLCAIVIMFGSTLSFSQKLFSQISNRKMSKSKDIINIYKTVSFVGILLYVIILKMFEKRVNFGIVTLILLGYILKYRYVILKEKRALLADEDFIENPFSVMLDLITNSGIVLQTIYLIITL